MQVSASNGATFRRVKCSHPLIERIYQTCRVPLDDGTWRPMDVYVPREEGEFLYSLVRHLQPDLTVEVGMANGLSTFFIAQALRDNARGRHVAIDPFQSSDWKNAGVALLRQAELDSLVDLIEKPSHQALPELEQAHRRAQFVFVDGNHLFDYVLTDFLCADRILTDGGLMAFDDSDWPATTQTLRFVLANRRYTPAFPEVVIEEPRITPTVLGRALRTAGKTIPRLGTKLRPDFLVPGESLGIKGRCVVLKKLGPDDRDGQSRFHEAF